MKRYAFATAVFLLAVAPWRQTPEADTPTYTVEALGNLGNIGGLVPLESGINASGEIVGTVTDPHNSNWVTNTRVVRYTDAAGWEYVPGLGWGTYVSGAAVNVYGDIAGTRNFTSTISHAFRYTASTGQVDDIAPLTVGRSGFGFAINDNGDVVGQGDVSPGTFRAFIARIGASPVQLPSLGGSSDLACGINNAGQIAETTGTGNQHGARVEADDQTILDAGTLDGPTGVASYTCAIDELGHVGGYATLTVGTSTQYHAYRWDPGHRVNADAGLGGSFGQVIAISGGVSVGWVQLGSITHAFMHTDANGAVDLNTLLPANSGWVLYEAMGINASGQIVGDGLFNGVATVFRMTPAKPKDTTAPVIAAHADVTAEATSSSGASVSYTAPTTTDNVDAPGTATCLPASGSAFALGSTTVTCNATDAAGNAATPTTFAVIVRDTTAPVIAAHADVTAEATGPSGASVTYTAPTATDAVDASPTVSCAPASGSTFALGASTVTCNASDAAGNAAAPTTFSVTIKDTTPPVIAAHADVTAEATGPTGASVTYTAPTATDAVDASPAVTCAPASGTTFALGSTTVTCNATDAAGNAATATTFKVIVKDTTAPVIGTHTDVTAEATGPTGASVSYTAPATTDNVDAPGTAVCAPASGTTFALGTATVTCNATDAAGNAATATTFKVTVKDTTAPVIAAHSSVTAEATGPSGAGVSYTAPATTDAVDGTRTASCLPASGTTFALGTTTVTCNATDAAGNAATPTTFNVIVKDTTAPVIGAHADVLAEATGPGGAVVLYSAPATTDAVDGTRAASCAPVSGSTFPVGTTTVTCTASDAAGNVAAPTAFNVSVFLARDTIPPVISMVYASPDAVWPPNGKMVPVSVMVTATDNVDPSPSCALTSITGGGAGSTEITGQLTGNVRADNGAAYVLTVTCGDASGNTSSASVNVVVTKTNGNGGTPKANPKK